jgi:phage FluMu gp28-like protein
VIVGKKKGQEAQESIQKWLATKPGFIEGYAEDETGEPLNLYRYQVDVMNDPSYFIHGDKGRQIGWSFGNAADAMAKAHLQQPYTSIFISINQEEANEKVVFAGQIYDSLPLDVKKRRVVDNKKTLEFEDANGDRRSRTRLISHAQREPRGKGGNTDVYLDESAHYIYGDRIYIAAVPIITRGTGKLITGSTPLGKRGVHYMLKNEAQYRRIFSYHEIYWWNCPELVSPEKFDDAQSSDTKYLQTEERVLKYGSDKLIAIYISMPLEDFQQEYELYTIDETVSYFSLDLIHTCCYEIPVDPIWQEDDEDTKEIDGLFDIVKHYPKMDFKLYESVDALALAVQNGKVSPNLLCGIDIGRVKHNGEFAMIEEIGDLQIIRYLETFDNLEFHKQEAFLTKVMDKFPRIKLSIDNTGMGMNLAENMWLRYRSRVRRVDFTSAWKEQVSTNVHIRMESQTIAIPYNKKVVNQIHSIKRKVTEHGNFKFDVEKNKHHHGDVYWCIALASDLGKPPVRVRLGSPFVATAECGRVTRVPMHRAVTSKLDRLVSRIGDSTPYLDDEFKFPGVRDNETTNR